MLAKLTSKERLVRTIRHEDVDRIAVSPRYFDWLYGTQGCKCVRHCIWMQDRYEHDLMAPYCPVQNNYLLNHAGPYNDLEAVTVEITAEHRGEALTVKRRFKTPAGELTDARSVNLPGSVITFPHVIEPPVKDRKDLDKIKFLLQPPEQVFIGDIPFLREMGRHFSINRMLSFDSVKLRLEREQPLTFLEFNYMILQAYDFLELSRRHDCVLQMGGSDQWGNIVNGVELGRRVDGKTLFGFTTPLITLASGAKMGKTAQGAIWLNAEMLSPYDYWQFWRNTEDADVGRFLRLFTELPLDEIARLESLQDAEINEAKKILADEATALCHGADAAKAAADTARRTFEEGSLAVDLPTIEAAEAELRDGLVLFELLRRAGLCQSNGEARRLIKGGGARVNDAAVGDEMKKVSLADVTADGVIKLSAGKKRHVLVRPV